MGLPHVCCQSSKFRAGSLHCSGACGLKQQGSGQLRALTGSFSGKFCFSLLGKQLPGDKFQGPRRGGGQEGMDSPVAGDSLTQPPSNLLADQFNPQALGELPMNATAV